MPRWNTFCVGNGVCLALAWLLAAGAAMAQGDAYSGMQQAPPPGYAAAQQHPGGSYRQPPADRYAQDRYAQDRYAQERYAQSRYSRGQYPQGQPSAHAGSPAAATYPQAAGAQRASYPLQHQAAPQPYPPGGFQTSPPQYSPPPGYRQPSVPPQPQQVQQASYAQPVSHAQPISYAQPQAVVPTEGGGQSGPRVHRAAYAASQPSQPYEYPQGNAAQVYHPQPGYGVPAGHPQAGYHAPQPVAAGPPPQPFGQQPAAYAPGGPAPAAPVAGYAPVTVAMTDPNVVPAQYAVPGVPAVPGVAGVPTAAPTGVAGCFAGLCQVGSQLKSCWCKSALGQMFGTIISPISGLTGGIIPSCCSNPTAADLAQPGAQGAASAIQANAADAKARRAAVKYLGTVDCHWFPEAEAGLIGALRADPIECVRWEAAHQLRNGCCCTKKVIEALRICVQGTNEDGNPSENSPRVRAEAMVALQECLSCGGDGSAPVRPEMPTRPENPDALAAANPYFHAIGYYREGLNYRTREQVVADARALVGKVRHVRRSSQPPRGQRSLMELWSYAGQPEPAEPAEPAADPNQPLRPVPQPAAQPHPVPEPAPQPEPRANYTAAAPGAPAGPAPWASVQRLPSPPSASQPAHDLPGESAFGPTTPRTAEGGPTERLPVLR